MQRFVLNVRSPVGVWGVVGSDVGLVEIALPHQRVRASRGEAPTPVAEAARQLQEYFAGDRRAFDVSLAPVRATAFQQEVWAALCDIAFGEVRTYADVARATNRPRAMRAVGNANHANPWPIVVPCHRVVAANGIGGYGGGDAVKRYLLALEGIVYP